MRVLLVDSYAPRRSMLAHFLARQGCVTIQVRDDQAARPFLDQGGINFTVCGEGIDRSVSLAAFVNDTLDRFVSEMGYGVKPTDS